MFFHQGGHTLGVFLRADTQNPPGVSATPQLFFGVAVGSMAFFWSRSGFQKLYCGVAVGSKKALTQLSLSNYKSHPQQKIISTKKKRLQSESCTCGDSRELTFVCGLLIPCTCALKNHCAALFCCQNFSRTSNIQMFEV